MEFNANDIINALDASKSKSAITITRPVKEEEAVKNTYYLKPSTIRLINKKAKEAGMRKSEFVQKLLEEALNKLEIE